MNVNPGSSLLKSSIQIFDTLLLSGKITEIMKDPVTTDSKTLRFTVSGQVRLIFTLSLALSLIVIFVVLFFGSDLAKEETGSGVVFFVFAFILLMDVFLVNWLLTRYEIQIDRNGISGVTQHSKKLSISFSDLDLDRTLSEAPTTGLNRTRRVYNRRSEAIVLIHLLLGEESVLEILSVLKDRKSTRKPESEFN